MLNNGWVPGVAAAAALSMASSGAFAQDLVQGLTWYAGGSVSWLDTSVGVNEGALNLVSDDASLMAVYGRAGMFFNPNLSGELRLGLGVNEKTVDLGGQDVDVEINNFYGAYLRGGLPVNETFYPYAVFGYTRGDADLTVAGDRYSGSTSGLSYGVGSDFTFNDVITLNIEYLILLDEDEAELGGISVGLSKTFE